MSRRGATTLAGILLVDKPGGMTSHDVVAGVRRATGEGRVGHAGTLDPMATGLLVVLVGPYARLEPYLSSARKEYEAGITFGEETDTDDAEGSVVRTASVPASVLDPAAARALLAATIGPAQQTPPAYSAIKVGGKVAYRAARAGEELKLEPRPIEVYEATLLSVDPSAPSWDVAYAVSKGTYVRALARDLGRCAGSAAHLSALRRTASGRLNVSDAHTLDEITAAGAEGRIEALFTDPVAALGLPIVEAQRSALANGHSIPIDVASDLAESRLVTVTAEGELAGVYQVRGGRLVPVVVLASRSAS